MEDRRTERMVAPSDRQVADPHWAWGAYELGEGRPWTGPLVGHLYRRAGFGATWDQLQQALADGPQRTIDRLLRTQAEVPAFNAAFDEHDASADSIGLLEAWWLRRMGETPHPLLEKMMLFWHDYFAANATDVNVSLMKDHVRALRSQALGSFERLLDDMTHDPALLVSLGASANRKARPNEGFVRALMEVFTLGPGPFTHKDVQEAARAFTGWFVLQDELRFVSHEHDDTAKTILGRSGNFSREDVVRMLLDHPATARTVVRRLYRWLISETGEPPAALIDPLAESFARDYDVRKLVETMLRSNLFFSTQAYRRRIKSPAEFALGMIRPLEARVPTTQLAEDLAGLGQGLCRPPTAKGWAGGPHWIQSATLTARHNLALSLLEGSGPYAGRLQPWLVASRHGCSTIEMAAQFLRDLFLQGDGGPDGSEWMTRPMRAFSGTGQADQAVLAARAAGMLVTLPEFHLA